MAFDPFEDAAFMTFLVAARLIRGISLRVPWFDLGSWYKENWEVGGG